jgi:tetratricopeptide (TPR) repeat protein
MIEDRTPSMTLHQRLPALWQDCQSRLSANGPRVVVAIVAAVCSMSASAMKPDNITAAEMALIPAYCKDANTFGYGGTPDTMSPNAPKWVAMMGKGFWAVHHYCWAQINLMRVQGPSVPQMIKQGTREAALGDLGYVIEHSPPDFILLPEIYTKMGQVQLELKRPSAANTSFAKARSLKPDYWPAYFHWAWYLQSVGQKANAKQLVEEGLSYAPDSKSLQKLLTDLGGDPKMVKRKSPPGDSAPDSTPPAGPTTPSASVKEPAMATK